MRRPAARPDATAPSHWAATALPAPELPTLRGAISADIVVVGAGFSGLSTALTLAEAGADVVVLEAQTVGFGASGRNNGQVIPVLTRLAPDAMETRYPARGADGIRVGERFAALVRDSAGTLFDTVRRHDLAAEAEQTGWLQPVHTPGRLRIAQERFAAWQARGADVALLDAEEMRARLGSPLYFGGIRMASGGHVNPLALAREMARAAAGKGARIFVESPVHEANESGGKWRLATAQGSVIADTVIVATNAYTGEAWPALARSVVPVTSWQMATAPLPQDARAAVLPNREAASDTRGDLRFFRPTADGRLVTGGALMVNDGGENRIAEMVRARLVETFPQLAGIAIDTVWNGYIGMTPDFAPRIVTLGRGAYGWIGCNGRGVALSVALGRELARMVLGEDRAHLALPFEDPAPIAFHALTRRVAPFMLARYRWRDSREIAAG
ncbi:MAG: FAD-dependent oxidoreductase [Acuticoccus sp.]